MKEYEVARRVVIALTYQAEDGSVGTMRELWADEPPALARAVRGLVREGLVARDMDHPDVSFISYRLSGHDK